MGRNVRLTPGRRVAILVVALSVGVAACGGPATPATDTSTAGTIAPPPPTSTSAPALTTTTLDPGPVVIELDAFLAPIDGGHPWVEALFIPYGPDPGSLGHDYIFGPSLPVMRDVDGRWWVADTHKGRLALFDDAGDLVKEFPHEIYSPIHYLQVLDDGTAIGVSTRGKLAIIADAAGDLDYFDLGQLHIVLRLVDRDGTTAYGYRSFTSQPVAVVLESGTPVIESVKYFVTRAGTRYSVGVDRSDRTVTVVSLPDANPPVDVRLRMLASDGGEAFAAVEAVAGLDGSVHLRFIGWALRDESTQLAVYVHLSPNGELIRTETLPNPYGELHPGDVANLAVDPISGRPYFAVVGRDGVRVWVLE